MDEGPGVRVREALEDLPVVDLQVLQDAVAILRDQLQPSVPVAHVAQLVQRALDAVVQQRAHGAEHGALDDLREQPVLVVLLARDIPIEIPERPVTELDGDDVTREDEGRGTVLGEYRQARSAQIVAGAPIERLADLARADVHMVVVGERCAGRQQRRKHQGDDGRAHGGASD